MIPTDLINNDYVILDKSETNYAFKVNAGESVTIHEANLSNSQVNLEILDDATVNYFIVNSVSSNVKRNISLTKGAHLNILEANVCQTLDETNIDVLGEHAEVMVENLCVVDGYNQTVKTTINHIGKMSVSKINNIGIAVNNANIMFDTTGYVKKGVSGCDCRQLSKGVIVGENSKVTTKPILLIDEYDVMAYHGATIGKMSDDELFYLMSRGLNKNEAFMLILDGLISPIIAKLNDVDKKNINDKLNAMLKEEK